MTGKGDRAVTVDELNGVWTLCREYTREQRRLASLRAMSAQLTAHWDGMPHAKSLTGKVEQVATLILESEERLQKLEAEKINRKLELMDTLRGLNLPEQEERVLICRYVTCMSYKEIARQTGYTRGWVSTLHKLGLRELKNTGKLD